ncbi:unnamed protein product [Adineta ricciae]|uniref:Glycosyltransferase family 28 N-terminal domain-containing protein n=1 Tax=Adineta ricciae TaxID=249248 RepID=A0A813PSG3_ADIRI|nr:unnamed protein product [Adineta ricciae]CAF1254675.1 unnamed protein product [Adineta ricciae]
MTTNSKDLTYIDFNHGWKCYYQRSNDSTIASASNPDQCWSPIDLPHVTKVNADVGQWWYMKQFEWSAIDQESQQEIYIRFKTSDTKSDVTATIWMNNKQVYSGSLSSLKKPVEISPKFLHKDNKHDNILLIRCFDNASLTFQVSLLIHAKLICATGQVMTDEQMDNSEHRSMNILDYTVSLDNNDGRIDLVFNPELKSKSTSKSLIQQNEIMVPHNRTTNETTDEDILVPRLAIVILIVGTRGDVQPFIALGQALHQVGHRVRIATHETFRSFVRGNGLEFYPLAGDPADLMAFMVKNAGIIPSMSCILEGDLVKKRRCLADILASTWLACIADDDETKAPFTAEAIIANPPSFGHVHCAEKLQIPLHIMFTMPWTPTTQFPHPLANIASSIGLKETINLYSYDVIEMLTWTGMRDIVNSFRKKTLGLRELHVRQAINVLIDESVPHTYCWSPSLVAKPKDWGAHIDVSGFFFLNLGSSYTNPPDDLLRFLGINHDGTCIGDSIVPPIYVGFGSITGHDSRRILKVVIDAAEQTECRVLLSGLAVDTDRLPPDIFRIGNVPHDWLFQYVCAVCHHGGAGTTAAGLRAGKPTIIIPFFGDQFFWGNVIEKSGAGPQALPGKSITSSQLAAAFRFVQKPSTRAAAERVRDGILKEDGCAAAIYAFHANLPLKRLHSDLEPTFAACYYLDNYNMQISRPVAQVLVAAGVVQEYELRHHITREWRFEHDNRVHLVTHGIVEHSEKAISSMFIDTAEDLKRAVNNDDPVKGTLEGVGTVAKGVGLGLGHLTIGCLSLYGEMTDALDVITSLYDPYSNPKARERPRVTDFKSGAKAAGLALYNGWKDGITGIVKQPRAGYQRHGALGTAAGSLIATVNVALKPTVGTLSSITWLSRGTYASVRKTIETYRNEGRQISSKLFDASSTNGEQTMHDDAGASYSATVKTASARSGFHPKVCQHILDEFERVKREQEQEASVKTGKKHRLSDFFSKK